MPSDIPLLDLGREVLEDYQDSPARLERKFVRLRDEWKSQRKPESSSARLAMHPAYQKIIGMGPPVVPLLLRELANRAPESWFWALMAITEANPVPPESRGDGEAMARAWLEWGKKQGYHC